MSARLARAPQAGDLTVDKDCARPAEHRPQSLRPSRFVNQQLPILGLQEKVERSEQPSRPHPLRGELGLVVAQHRPRLALDRYLCDVVRPTGCDVPDRRVEVVGDVFGTRGPEQAQVGTDHVIPRWGWWSTPTTTTTTIQTPVPRCSAAQLPAKPVAQDLPEPVAAKRAAIVEAAVACDYRALAALTGDAFTYSFGGGDDAAGYWRGLEGSKDATTKPLGAMVRLLDLRHGINDAGSVTYYVWPAAFSYNSWSAVPEVDKEALRVLYGDKDFSSFAQFGGYIGYRVSITSKGDWNAFVAGD